MPTTYGPLNIPMQVIIGFAFVAILTLIVAMVTFRRHGHLIAGLAFSAASGTLLIIVLVTVWTAMPPNAVAVFWVMLATMGVPILWFTMLFLSAFPNLLPKQKVLRSHKS